MLCRHCGEAFDKAYAIYCSKRCSNAAAYINRRDNKSPLGHTRCANCGEKFLQKRSIQFCCSKLCSSALYRRTRISSDKKRDYRRRYTYGVTPDDWSRMWTEQEGLCKICPKPLGLDDGSYAIDHCHDSGLVRGILCRECNLGLGYFKDSPELLRLAAQYVESSTAEFVE